MKPFILSLSLVAFSLLALDAGAETVYRWVDDEGVTHFTRRPPKNRESTAIGTKTGHSEPVDYSGQLKSDQAEEEAEAQNTGAGSEQNRQARQESEDHEAACRSARRNLDILSQGRRVQVEGEDGEVRFLDADEQERRREQAQRNIAKHCQD